MVLTVKDYWVLREVLQRELVPLGYLRSAMAVAEENQLWLRDFLDEEGLVSQGVWEECLHEASQKDTWPQSAEQLAEDNQAIYLAVKDKQAVPPIILKKAYNQARSSLNHRQPRRLDAVLVAEGVLSQTDLKKILSPHQPALLGCSNCDLDIFLHHIYPWKILPCWTCGKELSPGRQREKSSPPQVKMGEEVKNMLAFSGSDTKVEPMYQVETSVAEEESVVRRQDDIGSRKEFGRYRILSKLGQGGMGAVYRVHDPHLEREVALKVVSSELDCDVEYVCRFEKEARLAASLHHPCLIPIYEVGQIDGRLYYTMELVSGEDLFQKVDRSGPLSQDQALSLVGKLAEAMAVAHEKGVIHRDIKPENVVLDRDGVPHLMDFGLAKIVGEQSQLTKTGTMLGSPEYMAPEQVNDGKSASFSADIYSLGALLYFLLTGRPPLVGDHVMNLVLKLLSEVPPPIHEIRSDIDPQVSQIAARCLEKVPQDRFPSVLALSRALSQVRSKRKQSQHWMGELAQGMAAAVQGKGEKSEGHLSRALDLASDTWLVLYVRGQLYLEGKNYSAAAQVFTRILDSYPSEGRALLQRCRAWAGLGDVERALADIEELTRNHPCFPIPSDVQSYWQQYRSP